MFNNGFKKVIGQDASQSAKPSLVSPDEYASHSSSNASKDVSSSASGSVGMRNVLSSDVEIKGTVKFQNDLIVDGKIEGEIQSSGNLTVGENASIKAEIKTGTVIIYGKVHGNVTALERVELKASAEVVGDIKAKTLVMEAGAIFVGKSAIGLPAGATSGSAGEVKKPASPTTDSKPALSV